MITTDINTERLIGISDSLFNEGVIDKELWEDLSLELDHFTIVSVVAYNSGYYFGFCDDRRIKQLRELTNTLAAMRA